LFLSEDFDASVYNQVHQEQIVATVQAQVIVEEIPEVSVAERIQEDIAETGVNRDTTGLAVREIQHFQQCTIAQIVQVVTREQFHNDVVHTPRRKVRFATENDVQFFAASSRRAETKEITRALADFRKDVPQLERDGFVVTHLHQQCDDLEARIAVFSREVSSWSSPSSSSKGSGCRALQATREARTVEPQTHMMISGRELGISRPSLGFQLAALGSAYYVCSRRHRGNDPYRLNAA